VEEFSEEPDCRGHGKYLEEERKNLLIKSFRINMAPQIAPDQN
jgi:hypothetical protein